MLKGMMSDFKTDCRFAFLRVRRRGIAQSKNYLEISSFSIKIFQEQHQNLASKRKTKVMLK